MQPLWVQVHWPGKNLKNKTKTYKSNVESRNHWFLLFYLDLFANWLIAKYKKAFLKINFFNSPSTIQHKFYLRRV